MQFEELNSSMDSSTLKRELKAWEKCFEKEHGRNPTAIDARKSTEISFKYKEYERMKKAESISSSARVMNSSNYKIIPPSPPRTCAQAAPTPVRTADVCAARIFPGARAATADDTAPVHSLSSSSWPRRSQDVMAPLSPIEWTEEREEGDGEPFENLDLRSKLMVMDVRKKNMLKAGPPCRFSSALVPNKVNIEPACGLGNVSSSSRNHLASARLLASDVPANIPSVARKFLSELGGVAPAVVAASSVCSAELREDKAYIARTFSASMLAFYEY